MAINELIYYNLQNNPVAYNEEVLHHARLCNQLTESNFNIFPNLIKKVTNLIS
jgi:hypothetical protein